MPSSSDSAATPLASHTLWMFPGQGSQATGMGVDLADLDQARAKFDRAAEILGWSVLDRCKGDAETLAKTEYLSLIHI